MERFIRATHNSNARLGDEISFSQYVSKTMQWEMSREMVFKNTSAPLDSSGILIPSQIAKVPGRLANSIARRARFAQIF